jgi:hypothetical protein
MLPNKAIETKENTDREMWTLRFKTSSSTFLDKYKDLKEEIENDTEEDKIEQLYID